MKVTAAVLLGCFALTAACRSQPSRPAPVDAGAYWSTSLGHPNRAPFAGQTVSTHTPEILWVSSVGSGIRGMLVVTDQVIVAASANRHIYTLSRSDGSRLWRHKLKGQPYAPLLRADEIYVATADHGLYYVLHMSEGTELRRIELPPIAATPSI
ncbi:MAG TPA: PQQ-binding-like beta-propeller repeat protein, partial [Gemmatimonadota bacterium]|nr:PQQ-binding-like beta-propeller repeat protein [Gemmatimonadota bacterium]